MAELREATGCTGLVEMFLTLSQVGPALGRAERAPGGNGEAGATVGRHPPRSPGDREAAHE